MYTKWPALAEVCLALPSVFPVFVDPRFTTLDYTAKLYVVW